jgi:simple sugar transport system permease protein
MTKGRGWLAIVIVIAGMWRPVPILIATLAFCLLDAVQLQIQGIGIAIPYQLLLAMPYVVAILVLALGGTRSAPAMLGIPYSRE